ncbi:hypothetical protein [Aeromicrobium sp. 179-A 4D2 NHS]|uniref:hypothetical protein n=1 Tax=Aeromicrobium sp. 179-A 4D2 NHS TaxID=3142375 RepID=UPI0039A3EDDA
MSIDKHGRPVNAEKGKQGFQPTSRTEPVKSIHDGFVMYERIDQFPTEQTAVETLKVGDNILNASGDRMYTVIKEFGYDDEAQAYTFETYPGGIDFVHEGEIATRIIADDPRTIAIKALKNHSPERMLEALQGLTAHDRVSHLDLPIEDMVTVSRMLYREAPRVPTVDEMSNSQLDDLERITATLVTEDYYRSLPSAPAKDRYASFSSCNTPMQMAGAWESMTSPEYLSGDGEATAAQQDRVLSRLRRDYLTRRAEIEATYPFMTFD